MTAPLPLPDRFQPRAYQAKAVADLRDALKAHASAILWAPCGAGKTAIACDITAKAAALGRRVLFIADTTEIVEQSSESMHFWDLAHGIIQAGRPSKPWERVHIATIQTLRNRELPGKDLVFCDEAHLCRSKSWEKVITHYIGTGAKVIGLTATPCRLDGKGLGSLFQSIVYCPSIQELTHLGYLVPFERIYKPPSPSTAGMHTVAGDFKIDEIAAVMEKPKLIGDVVKHYTEHALGRLAILSAPTIATAQNFMEAFRAVGIRAEHANGTTDRDERKRVLSMPAPGVICQVEICAKGFDRPEASCAIDCRMTQSLARWLQFVGRFGRPSTGKTDAILLDHAGNVLRFGLPDWPREWSLNGVVKTSRDQNPAMSIAQCRKCFAVFPRGPVACPFCGTAIVSRERKVEIVDGNLEEIRRGQKVAAIEDWQKRQGESARRRKFQELVGIGRERAYKSGWAAMRFHAIYRIWPPREWQGG